MSDSLPLAAKMRPRTLDDIVGQQHLVGKNGIIRQFIKSQKAHSLILWGPPGTGKTTIAEVLCSSLNAEFLRISAAMGGVADIRKAVERAKIVKLHFRASVVFVDEIHRFNKSQQDALLPHVENGLITLIGATTENPSFSVNSPLLSRSRVLVLNGLDKSDLKELIKRALKNPERGFGAKFKLASDAEQMLISVCGGDARILLSHLEVAASLCACEGGALIDSSHVENAAGRRILVYDKKADAHYDVVSAFIKSMRGSDPDAATYYLARMVEAGEDPRFILRRMIIFASEDVGNADPQAIQVAVSAMQAYEFVGMPEGYLPLTQAATYLACAPKSNAVIRAYQNSVTDVKKHGSLGVPLYLREGATKLMKNLGYGKDYRYPHDFEGNFVPQDYLPEALAAKKYYDPTQNGYERFILERMRAWSSQKISSPPKTFDNVQKSEV